MTEQRDVVFAYFQLTWSGSQRRGMFFAQDRLVQRLLRDDRLRRVLIANAFRSAPTWAIKSQLLHREEPFPTTDQAALYQPLRLRRHDPPTVGALTRTYERYDRHLRRAAERRGLRRPALITTDPFVAAFAPLEWAAAVTLYATDDMSAHPSYHRWSAAYEAAYARVGSSGRTICSVSRTLVERIDPVGPKAVVPNGIHPNEWACPGPAPAWLSDLPGPVILYVGTLDARVDAQLVGRMADGLPHASVVLVGPRGLGADFGALRERSNVHIHAAVDRGQLPALVAAADVGMLPHVRNKLTEAMSPLKIYEYLAAGLPVAAVDLPPVRGIDARVCLGRDGAGFVDAVRAALSLGRATEPDRLRFLDENSWDVRQDEILDMAFGACPAEVR